MGLIDAIFSGINNQQNLEMQEKINNQNIEFQKEVNQQNIENQWKMWEATNDYNSPAAQMARYKEAGLNPNLIYGQQNTTSAMDLAKADAPNAEAYKRKALQIGSASDFLDILSKKEMIEKQKLENEYLSSTLQDRIEAKKLNLDMMNAQISKVQSEVHKNGLQSTSISIKNDIDSFYRDTIQPLEAQLKSNQVDLSSNDVNNIPYRNRIIEAQTKAAEFNIQLQQLEYLIKSGQYDLNEAQRQQILQSIEESKKRVDNIDFNQAVKTYEVNRPFQSGGLFQSILGTVFDASKDWDPAAVRPFSR